MDICINGEKIAYNIESEKTIGEILGSVESECEKAGMTVIGIRADGRQIPAGELDAFFVREPASVARIDLDTISGNDVLDLLRELGGQFSDCVSGLRDIPVQLQTGKDILVMETINRFSTALQSLYQALPLLSITRLKGAAPAIDGIPLDAYPSELSPILSDLLDALKNKDTVLVGDLSEYELAPRIEKLGAILSAV